MKMCPLSNIQCRKDDCGWWYQQDSDYPEGRCSMFVIANCLDAMSDNCTLQPSEEWMDYGD